MEETNAVNDAQTEVVEPSVTADSDVSATTKTGEGNTQPNEGQAVAKPAQSATDNAAFAAMRRENEALRAEREANAARTAKILEYGKAKGYGTNLDEIALGLEAERRGMTPEELTRERENLVELAKNTPEYREAMQLREQVEQKNRDTQFAEDLKAVKDAFPEVQAESVIELGEQFMKLRASGIDAVTAYKAVKPETITPPTAPGKIGTSTASVSEYYTSEELDALTSKQLDNPKIYEKAMRSMHHLKG